MTRRVPLIILATAFAAVACVDGPPPQESERLALLERGMALRWDDPAGAVTYFARAGVGTELERIRLMLWLESLERSAARSAEWRRLLATNPPSDVAATVRFGLARALEDEGRVAEAAAILESAPDDLRDRADERLVELGPGPWREPAARRLVVRAPRRLRRIALELEQRMLPTLSPTERIERSAAWRRAGSPRTAAAELRRWRWQGDLEDLRIFELARAEYEGGSPTRALHLTSSHSLPETDRQLIRGEAFRRRGWNRIPSENAGAAFSDCLDAAHRAAAGADDGQLRTALRLVVECGTEAGVLDDALDAWWRLEVMDWRDSRRDWLGRRLGVAMATGGRNLEAVHALATSLPSHSRCLRFWSGQARGRDGAGELQALADAPVSDLYGGWAHQLLGTTRTEDLRLAPPVDPAFPSAAVQWLMERGEQRLAAEEWASIARARASTPGEVVGVSELADRLGRGHVVVRWVLRGFPRLGTVDLRDVPENVVQAYLPLRWVEPIKAAAADSGLDPWLLAGVARQESLFTSHARSPRGAIGVLQLLPSTARGHARALGISDAPDLYDPEINIRIGARELARLVRRFGAVEPALAAYNAGETRTRRWLRRWPDHRRFVEAVPIPETYNYIRRVTYLTDAYRLVYADLWGRP